MTSEFDISSVDSTVGSQRYVLAKLEQLTLVFSSILVTEILLIERSQVLPLPFYNPAILGCVHHSGQIVPLVALDRQLGIRTAALTRESLTVIRLGETAEHLAGVGLLVDRVLGSQMGDRLPAEIFESDLYFPATENDATYKLFQPQLLSGDLFVPLRWQSSLSVAGVETI